jgi:hypothetical protein
MDGKDDGGVEDVSGQASPVPGTDVMMNRRKEAK